MTEGAQQALRRINDTHKYNLIKKTSNTFMTI